MKEINIGKATVLTSPEPLMLVCTKKENGALNMAPVSFFMYSSFNPPMLAFAMLRTANSGENFRRTKKAIIAAPGVTLRDAVKAFGTSTGAKVDKLEKMPIALQRVEGADIEIPEDTRVALLVTLRETIESGDHFLYLCDIERIFGDDSKEALFAWDGYATVTPAKRA